MVLHLLMGHGSKHYHLQTKHHAWILFPHSSEPAQGKTKVLNCKCQHCKHVRIFQLNTVQQQGKSQR